MWFPDEYIPPPCLLHIEIEEILQHCSRLNLIWAMVVKIIHTYVKSVPQLLIQNFSDTCWLQLNKLQRERTQTCRKVEAIPIVPSRRCSDVKRQLLIAFFVHGTNLDQARDPAARDYPSTGLIQSGNNLLLLWINFLFWNVPGNSKKPHTIKTQSNRNQKQKKENLAKEKRKNRKGKPWKRNRKRQKQQRLGGVAPGRWLRAPMDRTTLGYRGAAVR